MYRAIFRIAIRQGADSSIVSPYLGTENHRITLPRPIPCGEAYIRPGSSTRATNRPINLRLNYKEVDITGQIITIRVYAPAASFGEDESGAPLIGIWNVPS